MDIAFHVVRIFHIVVGCVAFASFWLPLVAKKGGALHRRAGWVYVGATLVIAASGLVSCVRWLTDANPKNDSSAIFLGYIALLTVTTAVHGIRVLRRKKDPSGAPSIRDLALPAALLLCGIALGFYGVVVHTPLFVSFAALGAFIGTTELRFWLRPPASRMEWFFAHMSGMGGSCIATVTAFVVVNARHLGFGTFAFVPWVVPGLLGGIGLTVWTRIYRRRFAAKASYPRSATSTSPKNASVVSEA